MGTDVMKFLKQHYIGLGMVFIIVFWACFLGMLNFPPVYRVNAAIEVDRQGTDIENIDQSYDQNVVQVNNTVQKLKSATLLRQTLLKLGYDYPIESREFMALRDNLNVKPLQPSNVIQITFKHRSALEAAQIVNNLVDNLMAENQDSRKAKIDEAISYVTSSLSNIRGQLGPQNLSVKAQRYNPQRIGDLLRETENELNRVNRYLAQFKATLTPTERKAVENVLTPQLTEKFKSSLASLESNLIADLQDKNWKHPVIVKDQQIIWREKTRLTASLKTILEAQSYGSRIQTSDDLCTYQVKSFELQLRRDELQNMSNRNLTRPSDTQATVLKDLEERLVQKLVELENLNDPTDIRITWIDKAVPPSDPYFPPGVITIIGLSLGAAVLGSLIVMVLLLEVKSTRQTKV